VHEPFSFKELQRARMLGATYRIVPQEETLAKGLALQGSQHVVEYKLPNMYLKNPRLGTGAQFYGGGTIPMLELTEKDAAGNLQLISNNLSRLIGRLRPGPEFAHENFLIMQDIVRQQARSWVDTANNAKLHRPGLFARRTLQNKRAMDAGGWQMKSVDETYLTFRTALSMRAPDALYAKGADRWTPAAGNLPSRLQTHSSVQRMRTPGGLSVMTLVGNEVVEAVKSNDPDGDRILGSMVTMIHQETRARHRLMVRNEFPTTFIPGLEHLVDDWDVRQEASLMGGIDFLRHPDGGRMARKMVVDLNKTTFGSQQQRVRTAAIAAYQRTSSFIGQVHNLTLAANKNSAYQQLMALGAEGQAIMDDPVRLVQYMAQHQMLTETDVARQQLERGVQTHQKGKNVMLPAHEFSVQWAEQAAPLYARKRMREASVGDILQAAGRVMFSGRTPEDAMLLTRHAVGMAGDIIELHRQSMHGPRRARLANFELPKPTVGRKTLVGHLEDVWGLRFQMVGGGRQYGPDGQWVAAGQVVHMPNPLEAGRQMALGNTVQGLPETMAERMVATRMYVPGAGMMPFSSWLEAQAEADPRLRHALTRYDPNLKRSRLVGAMEGEWDYEQMLKGNAFHVGRVRQLATNLGMAESEAWDIVRQGRASAQELVLRHELAEDPWRATTVQHWMREQLTMAGARSQRATVDGLGQLQFGDTTRDWVRSVVHVDSLLKSADAQHAGDHLTGVWEGARRAGVNLADHMDVASIHSPRVYRAMENMVETGQNLRRALVAINQRAGAPRGVRGVVARLQIDRDKFVEHLMAEGGVGRAEAEHIARGMVGDPQQAVKVGEFLGQETYLASGSFIDQLHTADVESGLLTPEEIARNPVRKIMGSWGQVKVNPLFGPMDFEWESEADGSLTPLAVLGTVEGSVQRGTAWSEMVADAGWRGTAGDSRAAIEGIQQLAAGRDMQKVGEREAAEATDRYMRTQAGGRLWMVQNGARTPLTPMGVHALMYEDNLVQVANSTELAENAVERVGDLFTGDPHQWAARLSRVREGVTSMGRRAFADPAAAQMNVVQVQDVARWMMGGDEQAASQLVQAGLRSHGELTTAADHQLLATYDVLQKFTSMLNTGLREDVGRDLQTTAATLGRMMGVRAVEAGVQQEVRNAVGHVASEVLGGAGSGSLTANALERLASQVLDAFLK
jgi:hypothetical protein